MYPPTTEEIGAMGRENYVIPPGYRYIRVAMGRENYVIPPGYM
jgi:hypothetical protein